MLYNVTYNNMLYNITEHVLLKTESLDNAILAF